MVEGTTKQKRRRLRLKNSDMAGVKKNRRWWPFRRRNKNKADKSDSDKRIARQERRAERRDDRRKTEDGVPAVDMMIELTGGGFFGGIDPVMRDHTVIKPGGRLVKEFKTVQTELRSTATDIDVEEYNGLAAFIESKGFYDLDRIYDCTSAACTSRKRLKPTPIPLRVAVSNGKRKKVINIAIWGQDERGVRYVDYPDELEAVIQAILKVSNGATYSLARG